MPAYQAPPGMRDILPPESARWRQAVAAFAHEAELAGYGQIVPPMFEDLGVFLRVGEHTDIVTKEMYDFEDKGGRHLALRPEQTASVVRAFVQHHPPLPWKVWYAGPNFRYESPQRGRYRQFDQLGVEVFGVEDPAADVEVIALAMRFFERLGLSRVRLLLNSLGDAGDRARYLAALRDYLAENSSALSPESRQTLERNPLRVLDSKRDQDAAVVAAAPLMLDFLSAESATHFADVQHGLRELNVAFEIAPRLVRGLDYYRRTTFEFVSDALDSAQNAVGGGGRYDGLVEELGGPPTAGIGFALGLDRTLLACDDEGVFAPPSAAVDVFVVDTTGGRHALALTHELRANGVSADRAFDNRSMKSQMKSADRSGAAVALIIGSREADDHTVAVRDLRTSEQTTVDRSDILVHIRKLI